MIKKHTTLLVFIFCVIACGCISLYLGSDNNWDLRNYHWYNAYAFLQGGRFDIDIQPAQIQTYYNPLLDVVFYSIVNAFPPMVAGFILGGIHGLCLGFVFLIALSVTKSIKFSLLATAASLLSPVFISGIGASEGDNFVALFILASLWLALRGNFFISAFVFGVVCGLKLTAIVFAVGFLWLIYSGIKLKHALRVGLLVSIGFFLTCGFWLKEMWTRFDNPLFPYYNNIFQSSWATLDGFKDNHTLPQNLTEWLFYPFYMFTETNFTWLSNGFRYGGYAVLFILGIFLLTSSWWKTKKIVFSITEKAFLLFCFISYVVWEIQFSAIRYLVAIEVLVPLLIILMVQKLTADKSLQYFMFWVAFLFLVATMKIPNYDRLPWSDNYFDVTPPPLPENSMVIMAGGRPIGYTIPYFSKDTRFIRIESNFSNPSDSTQLQAIIQNEIVNHEGHIYFMAKADKAERESVSLLQYSLTPFGDGVEVYTKHEPHYDPAPIGIWGVKHK